MHTHTLPDTRTGEMSFGGNLLIHGFVISYIMIMAYVLLNIVIAISAFDFVREPMTVTHEPFDFAREPLKVIREPL